MTLLVNLALLAAIALPLHWFRISATLLLFIPLLLELFVITLGASLLLAALYVYYRDLIHIWEVVLQAFFFASVIICPFSFIPPHYQPIAMLNPVAQIFEDLRRAVVSPGLPWVYEVLGKLYVVPLGIACLTLLVGSLVFRRLSRRFGEKI
jgi:ABC-2 type transport system permease protein